MHFHHMPTRIYDNRDAKGSMVRSQSSGVTDKFPTSNHRVETRVPQVIDGMQVPVLTRGGLAWG